MKTGDFSGSRMSHLQFCTIIAIGTPECPQETKVQLIEKEKSQIHDRHLSLLQEDVEKVDLWSHHIAMES